MEPDPKPTKEYPAKVSAPHDGMCVVQIYFNRTLDNDEIKMMREDFKAGKLKADPDKDLADAMAEQLAAELQEAYNEGGIAGHFEIKSVWLNAYFEKEKP